MGASGLENGQATAMGALIEAHDWSATALGPFKAWADPLRSTLNLCLGADFPVALWWGDTLVQLYNDPFREAIGATRHASGFACPLAGAWPDIWPLLSPAVARVLGGEPAVRLHDLPIVAGDADEGLFAMSLSSVPAAGRPFGGILAVFHRAVPWAEVDRAQGFLLSLGEALRRLEKPDDVAAAGCEMLGLHLALERAGFALLDEKEENGTLWPDWTPRRRGSAPRRFRLAEFGAAASAAWAAGRTVFDAQPGLSSLAQVPVLEKAGVAALVFAETAVPRAWSDRDLRLLQRAGSLIRDALLRARLKLLADERGLEAGRLSDDLDRLRQRQAELLRESQHRARRTLALIRALAHRSAETSTTVAGYAMHLDGRLDAFARVEAVASGDAGGTVELDYLVAEELAAHGAHEDGVITIAGPSVRLRLLAAQALGLAVHELVTHAVEDGALLGNAGRIRIVWRLDDGEAGRALVFDWNEENGQSRKERMPDFPLLEKMLAHEMNAAVAVSARPGGFFCRIVLPLSAVEAAPS